MAHPGGRPPKIFNPLDGWSSEYPLAEEKPIYFNIIEGEIVANDIIEEDTKSQIAHFEAMKKAVETFPI